MTKLIDYIVNHTERGECQCGRCFDKQPDREAPPHSVNAGFFWVSAKNNPTAEDLNRLLLAEYPSPERLRAGPSYIEIGGELGDQGLALLLIGLGELTGIWKIATPKSLGIEGQAANRMMGNGFIMPAGWSPSGAAPGRPDA